MRVALVMGLGLFTTAIGACSGLDVGPLKELPDVLPEGAPGEPPPAPTVEAPVRVPWEVATLRGAAPGAHRVLVEAGPRTFAEAVLPDGSYCIDAPMDAPGSHDFVVWAQDRDGRLSLAPGAATVVRDASSTAPPGTTLCDGTDPSRCDGAVERCDNGRDDDCNGLADALDPVCTGCGDDLLEPNDGPDSPRVEPGSYRGLVVCGGDADYYRVRVDAASRLTVRVLFAHSGGDVDLKLFGPDMAQLESSVGVDDDEEVTHWVSEAGVYLVHVYGFAGAENDYSLEIEVE